MEHQLRSLFRGWRLVQLLLGVWNEAGDGVVALGALLGPEGTAREGGDFSTGLVDRVKPFTLLVWVGAGCIWGSFVV